LPARPSPRSTEADSRRGLPAPLGAGTGRGERDLRVEAVPWRCGVDEGVRLHVVLRLLLDAAIASTRGSDASAVRVDPTSLARTFQRVCRLRLVASASVMTPLRLALPHLELAETGRVERRRESQRYAIKRRSERKTSSRPESLAVRGDMSLLALWERAEVCVTARAPVQAVPAPWITPSRRGLWH
jgi:hypothetical protein